MPSKCAAKCSCRRPSFDADQPGARGAGRTAVRQPTQCRGRNDADARSRAGQEARACGAFTYQLVDTRSGQEEAAAEKGPASRSHRRRSIACGPGGCRSRSTRRGSRASMPSWSSAAAGPTKRHDLPFETDGVVIKLDDLDRRERAGATSKFPRWAFAYKFPAEQLTTKLLEIRGGSRSHRRGDPVRRARSPYFSRGRRCSGRRCTTPRRSSARTSGPATTCWSRKPATSSPRSSRRFPSAAKATRPGG